MKLKLILLAVLFSVLLTESFGEKLRKHKKFGRKVHRKTTTTTESSAEADPLQEQIGLLEEDESAQLKEMKDSKSDEESEEVKDNNVFLQDACYNKHCGAGKVCQVNDDGIAECHCIATCPEEMDPRRKVCSNHNETWGSDCEVYQMRCWCDKGLEQCRGEEFKHVHIDYYGVCRDMPPCTTEEMADFPRRMRDWLFNIMRDLADRQELTAYYLKMEREAETNMTRRWSNAAIWKWCDLDGHPHDRSVSRHELFPIRAPLMALEHCISPFLNACDSNDDHRISLTEWGKCLEIDEEELDDRCEELKDE